MEGFGDEVTIHVNDASEEEGRRLDEFLKGKDAVGFDGEGTKGTRGTR